LLNGKFIILGAAAEPLQVPRIPLILGRRSVMGSFRHLHRFPGHAQFQLAGVRAMNEVFPLERAAEAYKHMISGKVRVRAVLTTGDSTITSH
jgi:D-arabinose 1-dehydrogenase-like Zn-dependent alcohol dehydrogenase